MLSRYSQETYLNIKIGNSDPPGGYLNAIITGFIHFMIFALRLVMYYVFRYKGTYKIMPVKHTIVHVGSNSRAVDGSIGKW